MVGILSVLCAIGVSGWVGYSTNLIFPPTSITPSVQDVPPDVWRLTLQLTGGLAGIDRQLELASTGELKVTDRRRGIQVITQASASELAQISSMVADLKSVDAGRRSACRDCIEYDLKVRLSGRTLHFTINDVSLAGTPVEPLANVLITALNRELSR
jgi:hypothetical protein